MKLKGKVVRGAGLGYKTANLKIEQSFDLPNGVYLAKATHQNKEYLALAIRGIRPDLEVFLLDFTGDLYGQMLDVEIIKKMRDLIHHKTNEELLLQIKEDKEQAGEFFKNHE